MIGKIEYGCYLDKSLNYQKMQSENFTNHEKRMIIGAISRNKKEINNIYKLAHNEFFD